MDVFTYVMTYSISLNSSKKNHKNEDQSSYHKATLVLSSNLQGLPIFVRSLQYLWNPLGLRSSSFHHTFRTCHPKTPGICGWVDLGLADSLGHSVNKASKLKSKEKFLTECLIKVLSPKTFLTCLLLLINVLAK